MNKNVCPKSESISFQIPERGDERTAWFYADVDQNPNQYTKAAARVFATQASCLDFGYVCSICDAKAKGTGGGGWFTEDGIVEHVIKEHPEAIRMLSRARLAIAEQRSLDEGKEVTGNG